MVSLAAVPLDAATPPPPEAPAPPQVLVRTFAAPAGLPWEQTRAAQLDARLGAPLPIADLHYRLKRLQGWRPRAPGRFAVFYVRRRDLTGPFETVVDVDGEPVPVSFGPKAEAVSRDVAQLALAVLAVALSAAILGAGLVAGWSVRSDVAQQLDTGERQVAAKLRAAQRADRTRALDSALAARQGKSGEAADVVADLTWLAQARTQDARILAVHWDHGLMAVESRGPDAPVAAQDRRIERAASAGRSGTWLWGISRAMPLAAAARARRGAAAGGEK